MVFMQIATLHTANKFTVTITGRIDAKTAPEIEKTVLSMPDEVKALDFDFKNVVYISSAGLRMLITATQEMDRRGGSMKIFNANDEILEIFEVTGFTEFLPIEY